MIAHYRVFVVALFALALSACATGYQKPQSVSEGIAYAYSQIISIAEKTESERVAGRLSDRDAATIKQHLSVAVDRVDAAKLYLGAGDIATAEGRLQLARGAIALALELIPEASQ